jgi:hypothetical protein
VSQSHAAAELHLPLGSPESRVLPLHS